MRDTLLENYRKLTQPLEGVPYHQFDEDLGFCLKPNTEFSFMIPGGNIVNYSINSHGFRGDEIDIEKPEGAVRIICAGDSSTFGYMVNLPQTYPKLLEVLLSKGTVEKNAEVINAGIPSFWSSGGVKYFEKKLRSFNPDILVFSYGFNDIFFKMRPKKKTTKPAKFADWLVEKGIGKLATYRFLEKFINKLKKGKKGAKQNLEPNVRPHEFKDNLEKIIRLCNEDGIHLIFLPISLSYSYLKVMKETAEEGGIGFINVEEVFKKHYDRFIEEQNNLGEKEAFKNFIQQPFKEKFYAQFNSLEMMRIRRWNYLFMDYCHPSPLGYRIIAKELYDYLIDHELFTPAGDAEKILSNHKVPVIGEGESKKVERKPVGWKKVVAM